MVTVMVMVVVIYVRVWGCSMRDWDTRVISIIGGQSCLGRKHIVSNHSPSFQTIRLKGIEDDDVHPSLSYVLHTATADTSNNRRLL